ncbi:hypothetical protein [Pantoea dispersa]|nr:hypothetical protein [Pantoea dispersa]
MLISDENDSAELMQHQRYTGGEAGQHAEYRKALKTQLHTASA